MPSATRHCVLTCNRFGLLSDFDAQPGHMLQFCQISWTNTPCCKTSRGGLVSIDKKAMELRRLSASCTLQHPWPLPSPVADVGVSVQQSSSEDEDGANKLEPGGRTLAGVVLGGSPSAHVSESEGPKDKPPCGISQAGGDPCCAEDALEIADANAWDWVTVRTSRGLRACYGKHAVDMEVTPVGAGTGRATRTPRPGCVVDRTSLRCEMWR